MAAPLASVLALAAAQTTHARPAAAAATAEVLFVTEAIHVQGEKRAPTPTRADGSCDCPGHAGRTFCPLDSTPGQCDAPSHKPCKRGGHCAPPPPQPGALPISTMNPSITVDSDGKIVLIAQANVMSYKSQQRPFTTLNMVSSTNSGRTWGNVTARRWARRAHPPAPS